MHYKNKQKGSALIIVMVLLLVISMTFVHMCGEAVMCDRLTQNFISVMSKGLRL